MNKQVVSIIIFFVIFVSAVYRWAWHFDEDVNPEMAMPEYKRCESGLYVRKNPHPCEKGDLIYVDREVAGKYCGSNVIVEYDDAVYCQYNGYREDLAELTRQTVEDYIKDDKETN